MNNTTNKFTIGQIVKYNDTLSDTHNQNNKYPLYKIIGIDYGATLIENLTTKRRFLTTIDKLKEIQDKDKIILTKEDEIYLYNIGWDAEETVSSLKTLFPKATIIRYFAQIDEDNILIEVDGEQYKLGCDGNIEIYKR